MSYKKLTETAIIGAYSSAELKELKDALTNTALIKKSVIEPFKYKEQIDTIRKRFNYSSKVLTISLLEKGEILPIYDSKEFSLPTNVPVWLANIDGKVKAIVNITPFGDVDEAYLTLDSSRFFSLLQAGTTLLILHKHEKVVDNNVALLKDLSYIYTRMVMKIFDRDFAINSDKVQADKASFAIAKFFLSYVVGRDMNSTTDAIAMNSTVNGTSENMIKKWESEATINYIDFREFFKCLAESIPALKNLTIRGFLSSYIRMFNNAFFAIESLQYFLVTIFSVYVGSNLSNNTVISSISGKHLESAFNSFFAIGK